VLGENHRPTASHWQTYSHNVVHLAMSTISGDRHLLKGSCKSNYHTIMTMMTPNINRTMFYALIRSSCLIELTFLFVTSF
jgi:hypothetical protein